VRLRSTGPLAIEALAVPHTAAPVIGATTDHGIRRRGQERGSGQARGWRCRSDMPQRPWPSAGTMATSSFPPRCSRARRRRRRRCLWCRFGIGNNGSRSQSAPPAARRQMPTRGRWPSSGEEIVAARQAACAAPTARPAARATKVASGVVRLWVAGRRSGQAVVARGIGLFPLAAAATA
jgi:hypothetical protein